MLRWVVAAGLMLAMPTLASAQDAAAGEEVFKKNCSKCHKIGPGAKNSVGPELNGLFGRKAGTAAGYPRYSTAMKKAGWVWDAAKFKEYIADPKKVVPGNFMSAGFPGLKDELDRDDVAAYIGQFNADGSKK